MYRAPVKSMPVMENGGTSRTLIFGSGRDLGVAYGLPLCLLQTVQQHSSFLAYEGIQKNCLMVVKVDSTPAWESKTCIW